MRLTGMTPLSALKREDLPGWTEAYLSSLWVETAEEAISLAAAVADAEIDGNMAGDLRKALSRVIVNIPEEALRPWMETPRLDKGRLGYRVRKEDLEFFRQNGRVSPGSGKGMRLSTQGKTPFDLSDAPLPPSVRLLDRMNPVQDQGNRGTCVAFAVTGQREFGAATNDKLSEQFLYWGCKMLDGCEDESGTYIHTAMTVLREMGICRAATWPYCPTEIAGSEHQGPPPDGAREEARSMIIGNPRPLAANNINHYKLVLAGEGGNGGAPVSFGVLVFESWARSAATFRTGKITLPLPGEMPAGGHAMLAVGYQDAPSVPGGGYLIVRNSWGEDWAAYSPEAPGHAMIPYAYIEQCAHEAFAIEGEGAPDARAPIARKAAPDDPHVVMLESDMRDINGKLIARGKYVIQDPECPERIIEFTPRNMAIFRKSNHRLRGN